MKSLSKNDAAFVETVKAHLKQIDAAAAFNIDEATLRAISGSLRLLLADNALARAWKASGLRGPMTFSAWCIDITGSGDVVAFCGGGDVLPGIPFSACRNAKLREKQLDLAALCRNTRIQVGEVKISTVDLVQYVANALGGSHYDLEGRAARKPKADLLKRLEGGEIEGPPLRVNGRSLLHHELLSIAQILIRSPEVTMLRSLNLAGN